MTEYILPEGGSITLSIDGKTVAGVQNYRVISTRDSVIQPSVASDVGAQVLCAAPVYRVELTRLELPEEIGDGILLENIDKSSVSLHKPGGTVSFFGCRWIEIEERCEWDSNVLERVVFLATKRVVVE